MRTLLRLTLALLALSGGIVGCARLAVPGQNSGVYTRTIFLLVDNRSQWQLEVFMLVGSQRIRLGDVAPTSTKSLQFSTEKLIDSQRAQFQVAALSADAGWRSEIVDLAVITEVTLNIRPTLNQSFHTVR